MDFFLGRLFGLGLVGRVRALGSYLLLVVLPLPLSWFSLGGSCRLVVQAPAIFLDLTLGSSLSLPVFADGLRWLRFNLGCPPSVASLWRLLRWFFVRYLLACPSWRCCASGFLGPVVFLVFMFGHLSQVQSVFFLSTRSWTLLSLLWMGLLLVFVRCHCLRLTLWASACVGLHGCPAFSLVGTAPSTWVPLLWLGLEGRLPPCSFSSVSLRDVVTLWGH